VPGVIRNVAFTEGGKNQTQTRLFRNGISMKNGDAEDQNLPLTAFETLSAVDFGNLAALIAKQLFRFLAAFGKFPRPFHFKS
jgi:hypothetical protein